MRRRSTGSRGTEGEVSPRDVRFYCRTSLTPQSRAESGSSLLRLSRPRKYYRCVPWLATVGGAFSSFSETQRREQLRRSEAGGSDLSGVMNEVNVARRV